MLLDKQKSIPLYYQIYTYYKNALITQTLSANEKLPSIRTFAKTHHVSTTTVEKAYQQLLVEGYIESIPKSGFYTQAIDITPSTKSSKPSINDPYQNTPNINQSYNTFDIDRLRRITQSVYFQYKENLFTPNHPQGEPLLRKALLNHLYKERGIQALKEQMILAPGMQNLLIILKALFSSSPTVAYLNPGYGPAIHTFDFIEFKTQGYDTINDLLKTQPDIIYLSPSNHYPTGEVLSIKDRLKVIDYAKNHNAYIIEDDYNHIYRYNAYQIPSMHSIASGNQVIYIGSLSRSLLVSMRLSYMILPTDFIKNKMKTIQTFTPTLSKLEQLTLYEYIRQGHFHKQLKKTYALSKRKNEWLQNLIKTFPMKTIQISGLNSNMHILLTTTNTDPIITFLNDLTYSYKQINNTVLIPYNGLDLDELTSLIQGISSLDFKKT